MCDNDRSLIVRHSYHTSVSSRPTPKSARSYSKSDLNYTQPTTTSASASSTTRTSNNAYSGSDTKFPRDYHPSNGEYYKKYEHDEVPVKDSDNSFKLEGPTSKVSLTNSALDNLEKRIFKNISQELQTDDSSLASLDSNIKFFKTTVERIFENFYSSMRDYEHYKKRFHEILDRSKEGSIDDMEDFIKDMFEHIMSSDNNSASQVSCRSPEMEESEIERDKVASSCGMSAGEGDNGTGLVEAYKNEHYLTDSTLHDNTSKTRTSKIDEILNIIFLSGNPCVEIKLAGRNLLSEINMKEPTEAMTGSIASADNLKILAAKKLELEEYIKKQQDNNLPDIDIPVKVSYAKKNIHTNEDFARSNENNETSKSFLSKLCNLLCRRFRKSSIA